MPDVDRCLAQAKRRLNAARHARLYGEEFTFVVSDNPEAVRRDLYNMLDRGRAWGESDVRMRAEVDKALAAVDDEYDDRSMDKIFESLAEALVDTALSDLITCACGER